MSNTKMCPNGHVMEATWDRCPYCPDPGRMGRGPIPPTRVNTPAGDIPDPTPVKKPAGPKKTVMMQEAAQTPVVGWIVALTGKQVSAFSAASA